MRKFVPVPAVAPMTPHYSGLQLTSRRCCRTPRPVRTAVVSRGQLCEAPTREPVNNTVDEERITGQIDLFPALSTFLEPRQKSCAPGSCRKVESRDGKSTLDGSPQ